MKLCNLLKQKLTPTGPWRHTVFYMKPKVLEERADHFHTLWATQKQNEKAELAPLQVLTQKINAVRDKKKATIMEKARAIASEALAKKKARLSMTFDSVEAEQVWVDPTNLDDLQHD